MNRYFVLNEDITTSTDVAFVAAVELELGACMDVECTLSSALLVFIIRVSVHGMARYL